MAQQAGQISPDGRWVWNGAQWVPNVPVTSLAEDPAWARPYESARFRAMFVTIFLAVNALAILLGIAFDFVLIGNNGGIGTLSDAAVIAIGLFALVLLLASVGSLVPAIVFFCMWLHRAVRNMPALGSPDPRWSPAGAVGRCFIPFLNLVHPLWGTLDAWRGSDPTIRWSDVSTRKQLRPPALIVGWWALYLIGSWISNIGGRMTSNGDAGIATTGALVDIVGRLLLIGAAVLAILVVRDITARQDHKHELIATGRLA